MSGSEKAPMLVNPPLSSGRVVTAAKALVDESYFGKTAQVPREKKKTWAQFSTPEIKQNILKGLMLARRWLANEHWHRSALLICKEWNAVYGKQSDKAINARLFEKYDPRLAGELVDKALIFQSLGPSGEADELGKKPYKIAIYGSTFKTNSPWTFQEIPIPTAMGKTIVHELLHHHTRWVHQDVNPWSNELDPLYGITSAICMANGIKDFRYTNGTWG